MSVEETKPLVMEQSDSVERSTTETPTGESRSNPSHVRNNAASEVRSFMPHRTHHGALDELLGISMFWSDKFLIFFLYLQRLALMLMWNLDWPYILYQRSHWIFISLLDFTAHHQNVDAVGAAVLGNFFEGCETICRIVWPAVCLPIITIWACAPLFDDVPLYYTRNIERVFWTLVRMIFLPFLNTVFRYHILNHKGNLADLSFEWVSPVSEVGVILAAITLCSFFGLGFLRSYKQVLFESRIRHEAFVRARELDYKLKFSCMYRNERLWMVSSYNYEAWFWSLARPALDFVLIILMNFVPVKIGIITGTALLSLKAIYALLYADPYRVASSNHIELVLDFAMAIFAFFGIFQLYSVRYALLVGSDLDYFLLGIHLSAVFVCIVLSIYYFIDGHVFGFTMSVAEQRAAKKWNAIFEVADSKQNFVHMKNIHDTEELDPDAGVQQEEFYKAMQNQLPENAESNKFYVPRRGHRIEINTASEHVWPVNSVMINELLRRNSTDHLIDFLRAAKKMLDRISALHNTPVLIPTDELKAHISRIKQCIVYCKRQRVTHHGNLIHPLQTTFEDLLEQFTYEHRVFSGRSVTVGHNARKMIEVSRFLRMRMVQRDRALALFSPKMRRILMKLFALRVFIQLVEERPEFLLPKGEQVSNIDADALRPDSDDDDEDGPDPAVLAGQDVFADVKDAMGHFNRSQNSSDELGGDGNADHQAVLAEMLANRGDDDEEDEIIAGSSSSEEYSGNPRAFGEDDDDDGGGQDIYDFGGGGGGGGADQGGMRNRFGDGGDVVEEDIYAFGGDGGGYDPKKFD